MIEGQLIGRGIKDPKVLNSMRQVPRHCFVPKSNRDKAYGDHPLPIGEGQTISQPYIVALMTESLELKGHETVLEIGTAMFLAMLTTVIAFLSFLSASVPPLRDLGLLLALGILYTFITAITLQASVRYSWYYNCEKFRYYKKVF